MRAVITVIGKDGKGIIAKVAGKCCEYGANISDITQSVLKEYFAMIMLVECDGLSVPFTDFAQALAELGGENGLEIRTMHEDIFNSMHRI